MQALRTYSSFNASRARAHTIVEVPTPTHFPLVVGVQVVVAEIQLPRSRENMIHFGSFTHCFENTTAVAWFEFTERGMRFGACVSNNDRTLLPERTFECV